MVDSTTWLEIGRNIVTILGFPALVYTLYRAHRDNIGRNTIWLIDYVNNEYNRTARHRVRHVVSKKAPNELTDDDVHDCEVVITSYDVAGWLARSRLIDKKMFFTGWGPSIVDAYDNTKPVLRTMRSKLGGSHSEGFLHAYDLARRHMRQQPR